MTFIPKRIKQNIAHLTKNEQQIFHRVFVSFLGKMAMVDGEVADDEIKMIDNIMSQDLGIKGSELKSMKSIIDSIANNTFQDDKNIFDKANKLFKENNDLKFNLVESLFRVAYADCVFHENEKTLLDDISKGLNVSTTEYERIKMQYYFEMIVLKLLEILNKLPKNKNIKIIIDRLKILLNERIHNPFLITVLGEFSSGKSMFINSLINQNLLKTDIVPTTATVTKLHKGKTNRLEVFYENGNKKEHHYSKLHELSVEEYVIESKILNDVDYITIEVDNDLLQNIDIADTPGFNSENKRHTEKTVEFISRSDATLWVFDANQLDKNTTFSIIKKHLKDKKPIGVINKIDSLHEDKKERQKQIDILVKKLEPHISAVFPVSSSEREGFDAVLNYFNKEIIPNAVENKTKVILEEFEEISLLLLEEKEKLFQIMKDFSHRKEQFEKDTSQFEKNAKVFKNSDQNLEDDYKDDSIFIIDILKHVPNYFLGRSVPRIITEQKESLFRDIDAIDGDDKKLSRLKLKLDTYNNEYEQWNVEVKNRESRFEDDYTPILDDIECGIRERLGGRNWVEEHKEYINKAKIERSNILKKWEKKEHEYNRLLEQIGENKERMEISFDNFSDLLNEKVYENADSLEEEYERLLLLEKELDKDYKKLSKIMNDDEALSQAFGFLLNWNESEDFVPNDKSKEAQYYTQACSKFDNKDYSGAIDDLTKAIKINPKYAEAYFKRGDIKFPHMKDHAGSLKDIDKTLKIDPNHVGALLERGLHNMAIEDINRAIEMSSNKIKGYFCRAMFKHLKNNKGGFLAEKMEEAISDNDVQDDKKILATKENKDSQIKILFCSNCGKKYLNKKNHKRHELDCRGYIA